MFILTLGYAVVRAATGTTPSTTTARNGEGGGRWNVGEAASKARSITKDGPILIPDPSGAQRLPIFLSHVGKNAKQGWYAFEARPPGAPDDCFVAWDTETDQFTSPCSDDTYPATGEGLRSFEASVNRDGDLVVDLTPSKKAK